MMNLNYDPNLFAIDIDDDGVYDDVISASDIDGDGVYDTFEIVPDVNFDSETDFIAEDYIDTNLDADQNVIYSNDLDTSVDSENTIEQPDNFDYISPTNDNSIEQTQEHWHLQEAQNSCAIAAQEFILDDLGEEYGITFEEAELSQLAIANGWYNPEAGTPLGCVGNLLEIHGIEIEKGFHRNLDDINQQLEQGNKVLVSVDATEILNYEAVNNELLADMYGIPTQGANHVVQVIGVDNTDPDNPMVIINDPGREDGMGLKIPADNFVEAWEDSDNFMVSTTGKSLENVEYAQIDPNVEQTTVGSVSAGDSKAWESHQYDLRAESAEYEKNSYAKDGNFDKTLEYAKKEAENREKAAKLANESLEEYSKT